MTARDTAHLLINSIKNELILGTKHYDSRKPGVPVTCVQSIIELMATGFLQIEPMLERRYLFDCFAKKNGSA